MQEQEKQKGERGPRGFRFSQGSVKEQLLVPTPIPDLPAGGNRITQEVLGAHDGGVFALCALRDGTLVSGGGRDRRVVLWGSDYSKVQEVEVRTGNGGWLVESWPGHYPTRVPNSGLSPTTCHATPPHMYPIHTSTHSGPRGLRPCTHRGRGQGRHTVRGDHP